MDQHERSRREGVVILHVEDDANDVFFVRYAFEKVAPDVRLCAVNDGEQAERYLAGAPPFDDRTTHPLPTLVLMDLKLPRCDGLEVLQWIRSQPALERLPVVILSSSTERSDMERAYALKANAYVSKQGDLKQLIEIVRGVITYAELTHGGETPAAFPSIG